VGIDWTLLLLIAIVALGLLGLIIALQTTGGRRRLADAALRLAESLLTYAIRWLESIGPDVPDVPGVTMIEVESHDLARAKAAHACLGSIAVREVSEAEWQSHAN
jgi:hypothetical protein